MRWLQRWRQRLGGKSGGPREREGATNSNGFDRARPRDGHDWSLKDLAWQPPQKNFLPRKKPKNVISTSTPERIPSSSRRQCPRQPAFGGGADRGHEFRTGRQRRMTRWSR